MSELIIGCLSQKGGVGKSTLARLVAQKYAAAGWQVKIADFNTKQKTSVDWVAMRQSAGIEPSILAEAYSSPSAMKRDRADLVVADGLPDSDISSLEIARLADLVIVPTGLAFDDIKPQLMFARELGEKGVDREKILIVLNKTTESDFAVNEARQAIGNAFHVAVQEISAKQGYQAAQNQGRAINETLYPTLNEKAEALAGEIVDRIQEIQNG